MKVAYDQQIFAAQRFGGISRYFFELIRHLPELEGASVQCRVFSPLYINNYLSNSDSRFRVSGLFMPALKNTGVIRRTLNDFLVPYLLRGWGPDILHETYYAERSASIKNCRTVITVYDMIHELFPGFFVNDLSTLRRKKAAIDRADHIICISENTKNDLVRLYDVPVDKMTVVHLGFALVKSPAKDIIIPNRPYILYVGSRGGYKNFDRMLEAYRQSPRLHQNYDLVAFGGGGFSPSEKSKIATLGFDDVQVRQVSGDDAVLGVYYKNASLFVYPSLYEGFGIPPLEAMAFGCPVACSNTSSIPEVVGNAASLFDPYDVASIADVMMSVIDDSVLQEELRRNGAARIQLFSWRRCARETLQVYQRILQ
ncbi:glycosyltransferase family 4 protein [Castellaniella caeni]|uniref:glycosyltransferase family 4 protein n=1 Tax=Castellaniella caeni TaxID=266123 RepID=UPI000C9FBE9E|nr:glycosyltransferase family 1 protein [Castellaniella caeni]